MCSDRIDGAAADADVEEDDPDEKFVEIDPTGRYGRYSEVLGKGAFKSVYKAFDKIEGIEVAWYQVHFNFARPENLDRLYFEVNLLKRMKHKNIIKFYTSWIDNEARNVNFITECFTSGTLREYRAKHKKVDIKALKNWARQILHGLVYMHTHDPPIVHRDLKCDNLFVNGNHGEVKIGDLGLATILRQAQVSHSVTGTPEFMAPELYDENYNELVDIYAFGMCVLELVTLEYPYSECTSAAQIMRKVTEGVKPEALNKLKDPEIKRFVEKCIAPASERLSAEQLLLEPFLQCDREDEEETPPPPSPMGALKVTCSSSKCSTTDTGDTNDKSLDFKLKGKLLQDGTVDLLLCNKASGQLRNINFIFDLEADTAITVATEMVAELDLSVDVTTIAQKIDAEIVSLVPHWKPGAAFDDLSQDDNENKGERTLSNDPASLSVSGNIRQLVRSRSEMTAIWVQTQEFIAGNQTEDDMQNAVESEDDVVEFVEQEEGQDLLRVTTDELDARQEVHTRKEQPSHEAEKELVVPVASELVVLNDLVTRQLDFREYETAAAAAAACDKGTLQTRQVHKKQMTSRLDVPMLKQLPFVEAKPPISELDEKTLAGVVCQRTYFLSGGSELRNRWRNR